MKKYLILLIIVIIFYVSFNCNYKQNNTFKEYFSSQLKSGAFIVGDGTTFQDGLRVTSNANIAKDLSVTGNTSLRNTTITGNHAITGNNTITGNHIVSGTSTLNGRVAIGGTTINPNDFIKIGPNNSNYLYYNNNNNRWNLGQFGSTLNIDSPLTTSSNLTVGGNISANTGNLSLTGDTTFGTVNKNQWRIHTPDRPNGATQSHFQIARNNASGDAIWGSGLTISNNNAIDGGVTKIDLHGDVNINRKLDVYGTTTSFPGAPTTPAGSGDMRTHFPNSNGNNYIRGDTIVNGNIHINNTDKKLILKNGNWHANKNTVSVEEGIWGKWGGEILCPAGKYVCGLETRFEGDQGKGDDSALNGIRMVCCDF